MLNLSRPHIQYTSTTHLLIFSFNSFDEIKAGNVDAAAKNVDDCDTNDATATYVFERIRTANKKPKRTTYRLISNRLGPDNDYSTISAKRDANYSVYDTLSDNQSVSPATQISISVAWIYLKDLLSVLADSIGIMVGHKHDAVDVTDKHMHLDNDNDYVDVSNYFNIIDIAANADEFNEKHKLLRQKFLGKFSHPLLLSLSLSLFFSLIHSFDLYLSIYLIFQKKITIVILYIRHRTLVFHLYYIHKT